MKIYLASRYSRRAELCDYRSQLRAMGHVVTSRWLNGNHQVSDKGLSEQAADRERVRYAVEDWEDLAKADLCISFTEAPRTELTRGGRHVEFGGALAMGKLCVVIGHRENVFHCLPGVHFFADWLRFVSVLENGRFIAVRASAPSLADRIADLEKELGEAEGELDELKEKLVAYEAEYNEDEPATIDARGVAALPSIDRDQMLADLYREVKAVGGNWPKDPVDPLQWLEDECKDLVCEPDSEDSCLWAVYGEWMAAPTRRCVGRGKTALEAIKDAMRDRCHDGHRPCPQCSGKGCMACDDRGAIFTEYGDWPKGFVLVAPVSP